MDTMLPILSPTEFIASLNQTFEFAYPSVIIEGELANLRVSKNRWVYFDLKDETASVRCFGNVYSLPGPVEDGMKVRIVGAPRMHEQYGFSFTFQSMSLSGEGTLRKAFELLKKQLEKEGLFNEDRKRPLPFPPQRIGLITSGESAAYSDFVKILNARWQGTEILHIDVQVQGESAPAQIVNAIEHFNKSGEQVDVLVLIRGGGSADDLQAFSTEQVTRAVAGSRVPTIVAIGHERDISLSELAADQRASTPSNAAELLVPDKRDVSRYLTQCRVQASRALDEIILHRSERLKHGTEVLRSRMAHIFDSERRKLEQLKQLLLVIDPNNLLKRGYAVVRQNGKVVKSSRQLKQNDLLQITFADGAVESKVQ